MDKKKEKEQQILQLVKEYCDEFHKKSEYKEGDRIPYASRVYDSEEMVNLVDSALEFWLTSGRYTEEFEKELQRQGVRDSMEIFSKPFYPLLKNRVQKSWDRIFEIEHVEPQYIQGAVWCIKKESN